MLKQFLLMSVISISLLFSSCSNDDDNSTNVGTPTNQETNNFIYYSLLNPAASINRIDIKLKKSITLKNNSILFASIQKNKMVYMTIYRKVFMADADGSNAIEMNIGSKTSKLPFLSPNGQDIVVFEQSLNKLMRYNIQTKEYIKIANGPDSGSLISFSPDGQQILYFENSTTQANTTRLYKINIDGSNKIEIPGAARGIDFKRNIDWSADASKILYTVNDNNIKKIIIADPSGKELHRLGTSTETFKYARFSPDSKQIACIKLFDKNKKAQIIIADLDGSNESIIKETVLGERLWCPPTWSSDGKSIIFQTGKMENTKSMCSFFQYTIETKKTEKVYSFECAKDDNLLKTIFVK